MNNCYFLSGGIEATRADLNPQFVFQFGSCYIHLADIKTRTLCGRIRWHRLGLKGMLLPPCKSYHGDNTHANHKAHHPDWNELPFHSLDKSRENRGYQ